MSRGCCRLLAGLDAMAHVTSYGKAPPRPDRVLHGGRAYPAEVARYLAARGINVWSGHNYAWELTGALGIRDSGGAVRAGRALQRPLRRGPTTRGRRRARRVTGPAWPTSRHAGAGLPASAAGCPRGAVSSPGCGRRRCSGKAGWRGTGSRPARRAGPPPRATAARSGPRSWPRPARRCAAPRVRASPMPWPRAASSTITSSIQARNPVGIGNMTRVSVPAIFPSERAMSSVVAAELTTRLQRRPVRGGAPLDSWGGRRRTPRPPRRLLRAAPQRAQSRGHLTAPPGRAGWPWRRAGGRGTRRVAVARLWSRRGRAARAAQPTPRARRPAAVPAAARITTRNGARAAARRRPRPCRPAGPGRRPGPGRGRALDSRQPGQQRHRDQLRETAGPRVGQHPRRHRQPGQLEGITAAAVASTAIQVPRSRGLPSRPAGPRIAAAVVVVATLAGPPAGRQRAASAAVAARTTGSPAGRTGSPPAR